MRCMSLSTKLTLFIIFLVEKSLENVSHQKYIIGGTKTNTSLVKRKQNLLHNEARKKKNSN